MAEDTGSHLRSLYSTEGGAKQIFSSKVADYVAARPNYPTALFEMLKEVGGLRAGSVIADIGAGTGLLTLGLLKAGYQAIAVEPNRNMRKAADRLLRQFPNYKSVEGSAESLPIDTDSVDLITAAQSFHWFKPEAAKIECLRVLRPHAKAALIWNDRAVDAPINRALSDVFNQYGGQKIAALSVHEEQRDLSKFFGVTIPEQFACPHEHLLSESGLLSLVFSRSYMPDQASASGREVEKRVRDVFLQFATSEGVSVQYNTVAFVGRPAE